MCYTLQRCSLIDIMNTIRAVCWTLTCFMFSVFEFEETQLDLVKSSTQENKPTSVSDWKNWSQTPPWVLLLEALHVWRPRSLWCFSFVHCHHTSFSFTHHFIIAFVQCDITVLVCPLLCSRVPADVYRCHHHHPHYEECDLVFV